MARPNFIELSDCEPIPILHEDRSVVGLNKPRGWMPVPISWQKTARNLQAAINSSIAARDFPGAVAGFEVSPLRPPPRT